MDDLLCLFQFLTLPQTQANPLPIQHSQSTATVNDATTGITFNNL